MFPEGADRFGSSLESNGCCVAFAKSLRSFSSLPHDRLTTIPMKKKPSCRQCARLFYFNQSLNPQLLSNKGTYRRVNRRFWNKIIFEKIYLARICRRGENHPQIYECRIYFARYLGNGRRHRFLVKLTFLNDEFNLMGHTVLQKNLLNNIII